METDAYALTSSGLDLVIRGMMRSLSKDPVECHSCMGTYDSVYFMVLSLEQVYEQWQAVSQGIDGSYLIFKAIVNIYEDLELVDMKCHHREIAYTLRNYVFTGSGFSTNIDVESLIKNILLLNYGIWWTQPEDIGFALGIIIKQVFDITLEKFIESDQDWECPSEAAFESRETYSDWKVGKW